MKKKTLVLVTVSYPYGKGEPFIAPEMKYLCKFFDAIEVVPVYYQDGRNNRDETLTVNLTYAKCRWGKGRFVKIIYGFVIALCNFKWISELIYVLKGKYKAVNLLEFARALYRAQLFDAFLMKYFANSNQEDLKLLYFYSMVPEIMGAISFRARTGSTIKIVARAHGGDIYEERHQGEYLGFRRTIANGIDAVYCISRHGNVYLTNKYNSLEGKCHNAKLGVFDPGFDNPLPRDDVISIISCSFIKALKRVDLIIDSLNYILSTCPDAQISWTHIGDGDLFETMREYASKKLNGCMKVVFTGYLSESEIMAMYRDEPFDVFINVSTSEGLPVSLMEAASVGLPLIATDVGGTREIVSSSNGFLIPVDSSPEMIGSTLLRFKDRKWASKFRFQSKRLWSEKFNASLNHKLFCESLTSVIEAD
jgi:colanic acid/amylovoran biosynthesis glycosyltransferase